MIDPPADPIRRLSIKSTAHPVYLGKSLPDGSSVKLTVEDYDGLGLKSGAWTAITLVAVERVKGKPTTKAVRIQLSEQERADLIATLGGGL